MSSADHAVTGPDRFASASAHRRLDPTERARTTRRWAVGVLVVATTVLAVYVALIVAISWVLAAAWTGDVHDPAVDVLALARDLAPVLLVGWCSGLAMSAVLARGEAIGPRIAGVVAGLVGTVAGTAMLSLTYLL